MNRLACLLLAMACGAVAQAAETTRVEVSGRLVAPPCTNVLPQAQEVKLPDVSLNQLLDDTAAVTEVSLSFDCRPDTRVSLLLTAGLGSIDSQTLLTSREGLGLRLVSSAAKPAFSLGVPSNWSVATQPLVLTLRVKPVSLGDAPRAGAFTATLLLQVLYL